MVHGTLCYSLFVHLEQSTSPLVDKVSILAAQEKICHFLFCTAVAMLHPLSTVSSLPFVIVLFKDTTSLATMNSS